MTMAPTPREIKVFLMMSWVIVMLVTAIIVAGLTRASSQEAPAHNHPEADAPIHEKFYNTWMRPDNRTLSCCNLQDCYPAEFKNVGGTWFYKRREDGTWLPIPATKFELERDSPDGRNHVCAQPPGLVDTVFCAITGGGT
jgi:hypothetical protein